jgi:CRP/FNR family transcriptional regulator
LNSAENKLVGKFRTLYLQQVQVDLDLLIAHGASLKKYTKGELIFEEGNSAVYFFQLIEGEVKLFCTNNDGKEQIMGIFEAGESFGEPPLLLDLPYPSTAKALRDSVILRLANDRLQLLFDEYPGICKEFLKTFAQRIYNKTVSVQILTGHSPREKVLAFLNRYKQENKITESVFIPFTRQQIADFTGLRVETVIRVLTKLKNENQIKIINHKVHF